MTESLNIIYFQVDFTRVHTQTHSRTHVQKMAVTIKIWAKESLILKFLL